MSVICQPVFYILHYREFVFYRAPIFIADLRFYLVMCCIPSLQKTLNQIQIVLASVFALVEYCSEFLSKGSRKCSLACQESRNIVTNLYCLEMSNSEWAKEPFTRLTRSQNQCHELTSFRILKRWTKEPCNSYGVTNRCDETYYIRPLGSSVSFLIRTLIKLIDKINVVCSKSRDFFSNYIYFGSSPGSVSVFLFILVTSTRSFQ